MTSSYSASSSSSSGDRTRLASREREAADLGLAVADQRARERMLVDQDVHQPLAFLIVGQDRQHASAAGTPSSPSISALLLTAAGPLGV